MSSVLSSDTIEALRQIASRHSRARDDAADLMQDVLVRLLEKGRTLDGDVTAWAHGALRKHGAFMARTAARRRQREARYEEAVTLGSDATPRVPSELVVSLPPAQRLVARLINAGLGRAEIEHLLGIGHAALRQRLHGLKRALVQGGVRAEEECCLAPRDGLQRRELTRTLPPVGARRFGIRDPDGIPIFFGIRDHVRGRGGN